MERIKLTSIIGIMTNYVKPDETPGVPPRLHLYQILLLTDILIDIKIIILSAYKII
jgi:hypothetical protein